MSNPSKPRSTRLDLICRKLDLKPGMRLLDVGCGWGSMALHAAQNYGVDVVGVSLSNEQVEYAKGRVADAGLTDRIEIRVQDYRDVDDGPYDAISSIGMSEHVGLVNLPVYTAKLFDLLVPQGRLLNHAIAAVKSLSDNVDDGPSFIDRYIFPDGEILPLSKTIDALELSGFETRDSEALREHYALTLRAWVQNLRENWGRIGLTGRCSPGAYLVAVSRCQCPGFRGAAQGLRFIRFWP